MRGSGDPQPGAAAAQRDRRDPWPAYHLFKIERYTNLQPLTDGLDPHARAYTLSPAGDARTSASTAPSRSPATPGAPPAGDVVAEWRYLVRDMKATEIGITDDVWNLKLERPRRSAGC